MLKATAEPPLPDKGEQHLDHLLIEHIRRDQMRYVRCQIIVRKPLHGGSIK